MDPINSIWITSIPRTGSMWTTNVVKEIFLKSNFNVFLKNKNDIETINFFSNNALKDKSNKNRYVLKVHKKIKSKIHKSKIILNLRNPYQVCASHYQFMKCKLDDAIKTASFSLEFLEFYSKKENELLKIYYEDIEKKSLKTIEHISKFCEISISKKQIHMINEKYKKNNVKKIISENDKKIRQKLLKQQIISDNEVVRVSHNNIRSFDQTTGFQTGHISEKSNEEWKKIFSSSEINKIIKALDPIVIKMGYKSQK